MLIVPRSRPHGPDQRSVCRSSLGIKYAIVTIIDVAEGRMGLVGRNFLSTFHGQKPGYQHGYGTVACSNE